MIKQHKQLLATCSILVLSLSLVAAPDNNVKAKSPAISNKKLTINVGSKYLLKIYNAGSKKVVWSTSRKKIATVTKKGVVKGKKAGKAIIKAKVGRKSYACKVTVVKKKTNITNNKTEPDNNTNMSANEKLSAQTTKAPATTTKPSSTRKPGTTPKPTAKPTKKPTAMPNTTNTPSPTNVPDNNSGDNNSITNNPTEDNNKDDGWVPGWY